MSGVVCRCVGCEKDLVVVHGRMDAGSWRNRLGPIDSACGGVFFRIDESFERWFVGYIRGVFWGWMIGCLLINGVGFLGDWLID